MLRIRHSPSADRGLCPVQDEAYGVGVSADNPGTLVGVTTRTNTKAGACSEQQNSNKAREKREDQKALANFPAHQTKSTPSESEEDRTQHLLKRMNLEPLSPVLFIHFDSLPSILPKSHGWQSDTVPRRLFQTAASDLLGVGGWEKQVRNQQNSWAKASTQTSPCVKTFGIQGCEPDQSTR